MAVRSVLQIGHPALKKQTRHIERYDNDHIQAIIQDLIDTMREHTLIGIAAPQIGEPFRIFITEVRSTSARQVDMPDDLRVYINPKIVSSSKDTNEIYEGCGSVMNGNLFGPVIRPKEITVQAQNREGESFQLTCDGILARVIQHEYDHLYGIEFTEKVSDYKKLLHGEFYRQLIKDTPEHKEASRITKITHNVISE
jgi:peptide deformylase